LFGIENITANNGWAMAGVGATIVFIGLVVLCFVISQIHKILELWEQRDKYLNKSETQTHPKDIYKIEAAAYRQHHFPAAPELASIYRPLVEQLKEPFNLIQIFEITKKMDLPHPHLSLQRLQEADILVPQGDGTFIWNKQKSN